MLPYPQLASGTGCIFITYPMPHLLQHHNEKFLLQMAVQLSLGTVSLKKVFSNKNMLSFYKLRTPFNLYVILSK